MPDAASALPRAESGISVLVPSWRRPDALRRCLQALRAQTLPPLEIRVGCRADDAATRSVVADCAAHPGPPVVEVLADAPGVIASLEAARRDARGTRIALTDDDAVPPPTWLAALSAILDRDPTLAAAGGRDAQPGKEGAEPVVGIVQWFGRTIGNHHLGVGPGRPVDVVKGVSALYRAELLHAVGFDPRLRGEGAQVHWEMALARPLRQAGWRLWYDPAVVLAHEIAPRADADQTHRGVFSARAHADAVHNETLVLLEWLSPVGRVAFVLWALLVGTVFVPGPVQWWRVRRRGEYRTFPLWRASLRGRLSGLWAWVTGPTPRPRLPLPPR